MLLEAGAPRCIPRSQFPYFLKPPILRAGLREPPAASYSLPPAIIRFEPLAIFPALDVLHPRGILKIPAHRFPKPFLKTTARNPADLLFDLRGVNGVAQIMARPVRHKGYLLFIGGRCGAELVKNAANAPDDIDIGPLGVPADIVALSRRPFFQDGNDGLAVVFHMQPVADVLPVP